MPRRASAESEPVNADSFLDIVASVVSIMIIMVLMVGLKIKNTPVEAPTLAIPAAGGGLATRRPRHRRRRGTPAKRPASWSGCGRKSPRRGDSGTPWCWPSPARKRRSKPRAGRASSPSPRTRRCCKNCPRRSSRWSSWSGVGRRCGRSREKSSRWPITPRRWPGSPRRGTPF